MIAISGYQIVTKISESANSLVYKALEDQTHRPIIIKVLKSDYPTPEKLIRYKQEYEITHSLNLAGVVRANSLERYQNTLVITFDDFGGESLNLLLNSRKFTLREFLQIAMMIAESLGRIHAANIIHKDINPSNIVFNPATQQLKIIDFGISTILSETPKAVNPNVLEGTLAYISPEQTGRMNRTLDYRTDFYSLGATFYELLTEQLPFDTTDAIELVHCQIAKQPVPPHKLNPGIPKAISNIVMKLLAKTVEERYQNAWGIQTDLKLCLQQLQANDSITEFVLGQHDISDKLQIPQKLYGRKQELKTLLAVFERAANQGSNSKPKNEMILVKGYSGIGKSSLVQEIYKPLTRRRGYFIKGKFEQYQRNIPYFAFIKALQELVQQILTESTAQLTRWQEELLAACGDNGQVIIDVIPEVELILGKQPAVPILAPKEAQNRFNLVFHNFIKVFTKPEHPLVIFLDDLQWVDTASLQLIQLLITAVDNQCLFFVGAYRDNEVSAVHPLNLTLNEIQNAGINISDISLYPLNLNHVNQLISDTLNCDSEKTRPLAQLVLAKTNGNPFFVNEFLKLLYSEKLLEFDWYRSHWQWDLTQIQVQDITDNVVELLASKIQKLNCLTQQVLQLGACIGNTFELSTLASCIEKSPKETVALLQEVIAEGLVIPIGNNYKFIQLDIPSLVDELTVEYKFVHDRIQQAAYSLIPEKTKQNIHRQIGRVLLQATPLNQQSEKIFDIVNQLNFSTQLLNLQSERDELATLNLIAGRKAKASAAYGSALRYLQVGLNLLEELSWKSQYELTLGLYVEAAEAAYLSADFQQMERLVQVVLQQAKTLLDKVKVYEVKILASIAQSQPLEAVKIALQVLKLLGVSFPQKPSKLSILLAAIATKFALRGKQIESLIDLPEMTEPEKLAATRIMGIAGSPAYNAAPKIMPLLALQVINLSLKYGNTAMSAYGYASYGVILCGVLGDIDAGYQFGKLALSLLEKFNAKELKARTFMVFNNFIRHWKEHIREGLKPLLEAYSSGLETGDIEFAAYCAYIHCYHSYFIGKELTELERETVTYIQAIGQLKQETALHLLKLYRQVVLSLLGQVENPCCLIGESYNEQMMLPLLLQANNISAIFTLYCHKFLLYYLFE